MLVAFGIFILLLIGFFIPHTLLLHLLNSKGLRRGIENNSQASLMRFISVAQECFRIANPLAFISSHHRKFINFAHRHCAAPILCIPLTQYSSPIYLCYYYPYCFNFQVISNLVPLKHTVDTWIRYSVKMHPKYLTHFKKIQGILFCLCSFRTTIEITI